MSIQENDFKALIKKYNDELLKYRSMSKAVAAQTEKKPQEPMQPLQEPNIIQQEDQFRPQPFDVSEQPEQKNKEVLPSEPEQEQLPKPELQKSPATPEPEIPETAPPARNDLPVPEDTTRIVNDKNISPKPVDIGMDFIPPAGDNIIPIPGAKTGLDGTGFLKVQVFAARGAYPVCNSEVTITSTNEQGENLLYRLTTDISGETQTVPLPTVNFDMSQQPGDITPYASYNIRADAPNYFTVKNLNVPIFDRETTIQPVEMVPLPENYIGSKDTEYKTAGPNL